VIPGLLEAIDLSLIGTPLTFERFTRRPLGWVGGYPQTNLFRNISPRIAKGVWLVGDSIFPGQSIPAVALGGMRVAEEVLETIGLQDPNFLPVHEVHPLGLSSSLKELR
jgi:phytoene dehydrogenase-like protein